MYPALGKIRWLGPPSVSPRPPFSADDVVARWAKEILVPACYCISERKNAASFFLGRATAAFVAAAVLIASRVELRIELRLPHAL